MNCTSHHLACDCREHNFAVMTKAMLDITEELDWLKNDVNITAEKKAELVALIERAYVSIEVVQFKGDALDREFAARIACCAGMDT